jgi:DNA-binding PadR family transcriptional regulator
MKRVEEHASADTGCRAVSKQLAGELKSSAPPLALGSCQTRSDSDISESDHETQLEGFLPLSPATFYILLALSDEDRHGYGIMQEVARQSEGKYKLGPGTFYDNLEKLIDHGVVKEVPRKSANDDPRRRYYRMTGFGRTLFSAEISRLDNVVREAKVRLRAAKPREAS